MYSFEKALGGNSKRSWPAMSNSKWRLRKMRARKGHWISGEEIIGATT